MLGAKASGLVWEEMGEFLIFLRSWIKSGIGDRVSRAATVVDGAVVSEEVPDSVGDEKTA